MATTPTTNHGLSKQDYKDPAWHTNLNDSLDTIDERLPRAYAGDPNGNVAGAFVGQVIYDSTNDVVYFCTTIGDAGTAVWTASGDLSTLLAVANNLSDVADAAVALANLGLTATAAELNQLDGVTLGSLAEQDSVGALDIDPNSVGDSALISNGVVAGSYTNADITVDEKGRVSAASSGVQGLLSVSQGDLNTSIGTVSNSGGDAEPETSLVLPGGGYGFYPQIRGDASAATYVNNELLTSFGKTLTTSYITRISVGWDSTGNLGPHTVYFQQRYVTASPPYDLGDGEMAGFVFLHVDKSGEIISTYTADVPPWGYNGPTDIRAAVIRDGVKYRHVTEKLSREQIMGGIKPNVVEEEITQQIKNADMGLIPHPFGVIPEGHSVVLLDPQSEQIKSMIDYQNAGGGDDVQDIISNYLKIEDETLPLITPKGVKAIPFRMK